MFRSTLLNRFSILLNRFERRVLDLILAWIFRVFEFDKLLFIISFSKIWLSAFKLSTVFRAASLRISSLIRTSLLMTFDFFIASIEFSNVMFNISWILICFADKFSTFFILNALIDCLHKFFQNEFHSFLLKYKYLSSNPHTVFETAHLIERQT